MNAPLPPDPYRALGVESSADAGAIKTAYRKLVLKCHPDKFPDPTLKAQKQEEFQKVQQAYEILGDDDKRRDYDLEVKAKKLKEELAKRGGTASANTPAHSRYVNVNIRTAEPPPGWSPSKHSTSKSSPYKPYSEKFSQSWENEIPRSKSYHDEERRARRAASYEKPKREDSRERRKREEIDREQRERRREREQREHEDELVRKEIRRQQKLTEKREAAAREQRERDRKDRKARELRDAAKAKEDKKIREREQRERERDSRRRQEAEEKARAKSKPYLEHSGYSDEDDDVRRSRAKKSSSPKKQSDSPNREKSTKQRERSNPLEAIAGEEKYRETLAAAASYMAKIKSKTSKTSPRHNAEVPTFSTAYPNPDEKFAAPKPRTSGDGKYAKDEPIIVDAPEPDKVHPEVVSPPSNARQAPPPLQKSHTMPTGYMPQTQTAAPVPPPRVPLNRAFTMQPEHEYSRPAEKHRSARKRASFDDDFQDYYQAPIHQTRYHVGNREGIPRIINAKYKDPYGPAPGGVTFSKVKTAPSYGAEHLATSRRYEEDDVMTADYNHMQPQYYDRTTAVR